MEIETYAKKPKVNIQPKSDISPFDLIREERLKRFGFKGQREMAEYGEKIQRANLFYDKLSREDCGVWSAFLPTKYQYNFDEGLGWSKYKFDVIPDEILAEIEEAYSLKLFDNLLIWTPEIRMSDPILLGRISNPIARRYEDHGYFLIARWGESLLPFEEIKRRVQHPVRNWLRRLF